MWKYKLDEMVGQSFYFYEINRSGRLPANSRVPWRGDTLKKSGGGSLDGIHEGGYFDAGDHNIFMLPEAYAIARLAWLAAAFPGGLQNTYFDGSPNTKWAREAVKWGADFLVRSIANDTAILLHIGAIQKDHGYLGRAEQYPQMDRNIRYCLKGACSDVTGEVAAALAHAAWVFRDVPALADKYWDSANKAYIMTNARAATSARDFGNSNDAYDLLRVYYPSSGTASHVFFAAATMWTVCKARGCPAATLANFKTDALKIGTFKEADGGQKWFWEVPGWDNSWYDGALLMAQGGEAGSPLYDGEDGIFVQYLENFAYKWVNGKYPIKCAFILPQ